ncbi:MAG: hypothetical protein WKG00_08180 [Polyangiaceae bacterium]
MTKIGRMGIAAGASLLLSGCGFWGSDSEGEGEGTLEPPPPPTLPAGCHVVNDQIAANTFQAMLLPTDQGTFASWIEYPDDLQGPVPAILAVAAVDDGLAAGTATRVSIGTAPVDELLQSQLMVPVGSSLLVVAGAKSALVPLSDPTSLTPVALEPMTAAAGLALDDDRVALLDASSGALRYRVLQTADASITLDVELAETTVTVDAAPAMLAFLGQALRLLTLGDGDLLALWVGDTGSVARAIRFRADGTVVAGPTDIAASLPGKSIFVPDAVELASGEIAIAWTGTSGTEVRAALLSSELEGAADAGVVVNGTTDGSQEYARVFLRDDELRVAWNLQGGGVQQRSLDVGSGALTPTGEDTDAVGGCAADLGSDLGVASDGDPTAIWIDQGWDGPRRILVERVR